MGIFGGSKKMCPVCGNPSARFLPVKVEGEPLCADCAGKHSLFPPDINMKTITVQKYRDFVTFYNENAALRDMFKESYQYVFGFLGGAISLDVPNRLIRFSTSNSSVVFESSNIRSFSITEDASELFTGTKDALICCRSAVPERVKNLGPDINRYMVEYRQYEQMERMDKMLKEQAEKEGKSYMPEYYPAPDVNRLKPFEKFRVKFELDHPYWNFYDYAKSAPDFYTNNPSIQAYLDEYEGKVTEMRKLAGEIMNVINPDAPKRQMESSDLTGSQTPDISQNIPVDAVAEIQKYKELFDSGAVTEEEFTAKKRQLLGI